MNVTDQVSANESHRPSPLLSIAWGAAGGLIGALAAHASVILAVRLTGESDIWLKGPHGPPFFNLTLSTGVFYGVLGGLINQGRPQRVRGAWTGFLASFFAMALPMIFASYVFTWGEDPKAGETRAWIYWVLGSYIFATAAAAIALGLFSSTPRSWKAAAGACGGALTAWGLQFTSRVFFPKWNEAVEVMGWLAPPSAITSGVLWGALIAFGISLSLKGEGQGVRVPPGGSHEETSRA